MRTKGLVMGGFSGWAKSRPAFLVVLVLGVTVCSYDHNISMQYCLVLQLTFMEQVVDIRTNRGSRSVCPIVRCCDRDTTKRCEAL